MAGGRPLKFESPEQMQEAIDTYFASCWDSGVEGEGKIKTPYTITGLALALNTDRATLIHYQDRPEFFNTVKQAKLKCENFAENQLFTGRQVAGVIFSLKNNYGWKDKTEVETDNTHTIRWASSEAEANNG